MEAVAKRRPEDPIEFLAHYMLEHNTKKTKTGDMEVDGQEAGG